MSKQINTEKLRQMGIGKVREVCIRHATLAVVYRANGNTRMLDAHCNLLDQCAAVGRELLGNGPLKHNAREQVCLV